MNRLGIQTAAFAALASVTAGKALAEPDGRCTKASAAIDLSAPQWNGWGRDVENSRYQPSPGFKAKDVPRLKLKWAFGYPDAMITYGQPTIAGGRVFVTSTRGKVFSLDAATGCAHWTFDAGVAVRTALTIGTAQPTGRFAAYFGDVRASAYAVDATNGTLIWKTSLDEHRAARITGAPSLHAGRLYIPVSSEEETVSQNYAYECCTFRGSLVALDAATGKILWKSHTILDAPKPFAKNPFGTQMHGPAGAAVWSAPTIDVKRGLVYVGTGNSYTDVPTSTSDAILAFDIEMGELRWARQATPNDNYIMGCGPPLPGAKPSENCPKQVGPDFDFGSSPILRRLPNGRDIIVAGQKSGIVYGFDPDNDGAILWQTRVGEGGPLGGVQWGLAADADHVYAAVSDLAWPLRSSGSLAALRIATGEVAWRTAAPYPVCSWGDFNCYGAQSAAVTAIPGVVFSGSMDGHLRAYAAGDGPVIWDFDTAQTFKTVNGTSARGGSLDAGGPTVAGGMLFVNSGYGVFLGRGGNVLLAFSADGAGRRQNPRHSR